MNFRHLVFNVACATVATTLGMTALLPRIAVAAGPRSGRALAHAASLLPTTGWSKRVLDPSRDYDATAAGYDRNGNLGIIGLQELGAEAYSFLGGSQQLAGRAVSDTAGVAPAPSSGLLWGYGQVRSSSSSDPSCPTCVGTVTNYATLDIDHIFSPAPSQEYRLPAGDQGGQFNALATDISTGHVFQAYDHQGQLEVRDASSGKVSDLPMQSINSVRIAAGHGQAAVVATNADGIEAFTLRESSGTWSAPSRLASGGSNADIAIDPAGNPVVAWDDTAHCCTLHLWFGGAAGGRQLDTRVPASQLGLAIDPRGLITVAFSLLSSSSCTIYWETADGQVGNEIANCEGNSFGVLQIDPYSHQARYRTLQSGINDSRKPAVVASPTQTSIVLNNFDKSSGIVVYTQRSAPPAVTPHPTQPSPVRLTNANLHGALHLPKSGAQIVVDRATGLARLGWATDPPVRDGVLTLTAKRQGQNDLWLVHDGYFQVKPGTRRVLEVNVKHSALRLLAVHPLTVRLGAVGTDTGGHVAYLFQDNQLVLGK